jgi:hypothetical protein
MKRSIDMVQSRPCQIDREVLTEHFGPSWVQEVDRFEDAREGAEFCIKTQIREAEQEELETFMPDEKKIRDVIKSRQDLSVNGVDGIGHRIVRAAEKEGVSLMRVLIGACIREGGIPDAWNQAKTMLPYKKASRGEIRNWRPISITHCVDRIFRG